MSEPDNDKFKDFSDKLAQHQKVREAKEKESRPNPVPVKEMNLGVRILVDMFAAMIVGTLLGFGVDSFFDTQPFGIIVGLIVGLAAGVTNLVRTIENWDKKNDSNDLQD